LNIKYDYLVQESVVKEKEGKKLYDYQKNDLDEIFRRINEHPDNYNFLYQLPTGGGKTVIFTEIAKRYIQETGKKALVLTHRIELCKQTSNMLFEFGVKNKIINSKVKELPDQADFTCFVAMVETLNNRLNDGLDISDVGLVIIDEAHYNSFRKLFKHFEKCIILGVTATPLSSNIKLPMYENYDELIVGNSINSLIGSGFLSKATTYSFDVSLRSLRIGINGDYTVRSSELLYGNYSMLEKLLYAYEQKSKNKKTLIFNNGINTSKLVHETFYNAGYDVKHLDNTNSDNERKEIIQWFKHTPNAILTSVGILTTGFDEPTVDTIILNRATKSLTLYHQMIGRGSRVLPNKKEFTVIDMGNNAARFGLWSTPIDWYAIFKSPDFYLQNIVDDEEIERQFRYLMPEELREKFKNSTDLNFDIKADYKNVLQNGLRPKVAIDNSINHHAKICIENAEEQMDSLALVDLLKDDIEYKVKQYSYCICKSTPSYIKWLREEYTRKLRYTVRQAY
jgi:superfamily II DNA or RNA helicase